MKSNFDFLATEFPELYTNARQAETYLRSDPIGSAFFSRRTLEYALYWMYENDPDFPDLDEMERAYGRYYNISHMMDDPAFAREIPPKYQEGLQLVRKNGNAASHRDKQKRKFNPHLAEVSLFHLHPFLQWFAQAYYEHEKPEELPFDMSVVRQSGKVISDDERQKLEKEQEAFKAQRAQLQEERKQLEEEKAKLRAEQQQNRQRRQDHAKYGLPDVHYSEAETRQLFVNVLLMEAGWDPDAPDTSEYPVTGLPESVSTTGKGKADYVLWNDDGKPLAVVEAKKTMHEAYRGQHQAKLYADCLEQMKGQRPVIFFTNGFETWLWDDVFYPPRKVMGFLNKEALQLLIKRRTSRRDLTKVPINKDIAGRPYQREAIKRVAHRYQATVDGQLRGAHRRALVVMATGAGKTRTSAALVDVLSKAGWAKRILFLADRTALVTQAKNAFHTYLPHLTAIDLTKEKEDQTTRLVFSTYPTIMNCIESDQGSLYPIGHFDLIIIDEAHRSIYQKYRAIFDYFDAMLLGLTATPKDEVDHDTYDFFQCDNGDPTAKYELGEAVHDKHLVPPKGQAIDLGFIRRGIKYSELSKDEQDKYEETFRDEFGHVPEEIGAAAINQWLFNKDTINKMLGYLMQNGLKVQGGDKIGKSIIFAKNHLHADLIRKYFDEQYPQHGGDFMQVVTHNIDKVQDLIDKFKQPASYPQIAVSVDMLDTGIDVPEIVNLVFFKPVYSKAKFWQMIGRGTRLSPNLFGPGEDKAYFYVFDFCGNYEFFGQNPEGIQAGKSESLSASLFKKRIELAEVLRGPKFQEEDYQDHRRHLLDLSHFEVNKLWNRQHNISIRSKLQHISGFKDRAPWDSLSRAALSDIFEHIARLVELDEPDEYAKRFDMLIYQLQYALLKEDPNISNWQARLTTTSQKLLLLSNVEVVRLKLVEIEAILSASYWEHLTLEKLENTRLALRDLIRLFDQQNKQKIYHTNFRDSIVGVSEHNYMPVYSSFESYEKRVHKLIENNKDHLAIRKLHTNLPITSEELKELERILLDDMDEEQRQKMEEEMHHEPLGLLLRNVMGLDRQAAKAAFVEFDEKNNLSPDQLRFINQIIDHLSQNGFVDSGMLYEVPYTNINDQGIDAIFPKQDADKIFEILGRIKGNAVA